ncbi:MAG: hypothetical protein RMJ17_01360 [Candidatus Aenigmarchaeota archaeon]|nr:hypothetical protein [Candidatus Aenigmarchaeota archaeon]MDW8149229.1 hypothetical protein [Candidatus Aenigmarchaeota archaeon]
MEGISTERNYWIILIFLLIQFSYSQIANLIIYPTQIYECIKFNRSSICNLTNIVTNDTLYEYLDITDSSSRKFGRINVSFFNLSIPHHWINVLRIYIKMRSDDYELMFGQHPTPLGNNEKDECYIAISENSTGIFIYSYVLTPSYISCKNFSNISLFIQEFEVTSFLNHINKIRSSAISWRGYDENDLRVGLAIDFIHIIVNYFNLTFSNWNLSKSEINRGELVNIHALFNITDVNHTFLIITTPLGEIVVLNRSYAGISNISLYLYWVNYTFNSFERTYKIAGIYSFGPIFVNNSFGGYNATFPKLNLTLWSFPMIERIFPEDYYIYVNENINILCAVSDNTTLYPLSRQPVRFWIDGSADDFNRTTNESGIATRGFLSSSVGNRTIDCEVFGNISSYYKQNLILRQNKSSTWVKVLELSAIPKLNKTTNIKVREPIRIFVNITNASFIKNVNAAINYLKINSSGSFNIIEFYNLTFSRTYAPDLQEYCLDYIPNSSGLYNVYITTEANQRTAFNSTSFFVDFGRIEIDVEFPKNKLLINQTFFAKIKFKAIDGDVLNINASLNSSNYSRLQLNNDVFFNSLFNLSSGETFTINKFWNLTSNDFGSVLLNITAIPSNGTYNSTSFNISIIGFETFILNKTLDFGNSTTIKAVIEKDSNATIIENVYLITKFFNITDYNTIELTNLKIDMQHIGIESNKYIFSTTFIPPRSGNYSGVISLNLTSTIITNSTENFNVSFGTSKISFLIPFYYVLTNQTFNITAIAEALNGDLWNVSFNLTIFDQKTINITENENFFHGKNIFIKNGSKYFEKWLAFSNNSGLNRMIVSLVSLYSNSSADESFEIIEPLEMEIENNQTYIDEFSNLIVPVVGNASEVNVNFTIFKAFDSGVESFLAKTVTIKNVIDCNIEIETGNVALLEKGSSAFSLGGSNANFSIDNNNNTAWITFSKDYLIVNLRSIFPVGKIELLWFGPSNSFANISYINENNEIIILEKNILIPTSLSTIVFDKFTPFKTSKFIINISNGVSLYEFRAFATFPRLDYCYVFSYKFSNFTRSGNYSVFSNILTKANDLIKIKNKTFFVKFGYPVITITADRAMLSGQNQTYYVSIFASKGDLRNLTIEFNSEDENYINITEGEKKLKFIDEVFYNKSSEKISWKIKAKLFGESNKTILTFINVTSNTSMSYNNSSEFDITIYPFDLEPPTINSFHFEINSIKTNKSNINDNLIIVANVTDSIFVKEVNASIVYPNGIEKNVSLTKYDKDLFIFEFSKTDKDIQINESGNYSVKIFAVDLNTSSNIVESEESNFTVYSNYTIELLTPFSFFNRGEKIVLVVRDVNRFKVNNSNITIYLIDSDNQTINKTSFISSNGIVEFFLDPNYSLQTYKLNITAIKYNNFGFNSTSFTLTNLLKIKILIPSEGLTLDPGKTIKSVEGLPRAKIYNYREDREIKNAIANILCYDINSVFTIYNETEFYYNACVSEANDTYSFSGCVDRCYSPNNYGANFNITIVAYDNFNNSGSSFVNLKTTSLTLPSPPSPGITGGIGIAPNVSCICEKDIARGCGISPCRYNEMYFERIGCNQYCSPNQTFYCKFSPECNISYSISFKGNETRIYIASGTNRTIFAKVENNGYSRLKIKLFYSINCINCAVYATNESILEINPGEEKELSFIINPFLNSTTGEYIFTLFSESEYLTSRESITIVVNENDEIKILKNLKEEIKNLEKIYNEYKNFGISLKKSFEELNSILKSGEKAIEENSLEKLIDVNANMKRKIEEMKKEISEKYLLFVLSKFKYVIILLSITAFSSIYLILEVIVPYFKITREISYLASKEKELVNARKESEEQYFKRKISEKAFYDMMIKYQSEILKIRGKIKELNIIRKNLLREALKAKTFIDFLKKMNIMKYLKYRKKKV